MRETTPVQGMRLYVARTTPDCTNGGITAVRDRLTLVGTVLPFIGNGADPAPVRPMPVNCRLWDASDQAPAVALELTAGTVHLVPVGLSPDGTRYLRDRVHYMAGGNFAHSSDSRVGDVLREVLGHRFYGALSVHDRREA